MKHRLLMAGKMKTGIKVDGKVEKEIYTLRMDMVKKGNMTILHAQQASIIMMYTFLIKCDGLNQVTVFWWHG